MGCTKELFVNSIAEIRNEKDNTYLKKRNASLLLAAVMIYAVWFLI